MIISPTKNRGPEMTDGDIHGSPSPISAPITPPVHILFQNQNQPQELKVKGLIFPLPHLIFG